MLAELALADVADPKQTVAERLGEWLGFKDALALYSALNAPPAGTQGRGLPVARLHDAVRSVRIRLAADVMAVESEPSGRPDRGLPMPLPGASVEAAADYAPFHRYYLAHQRAMAASIAPLRAQVRAALGQQAAALKQLAALDAVMEQALAGREASVLATVPALLGKRFAQLLEAHQRLQAGSVADQTVRDETAEKDDPARWAQAGGWLARFGAEMQRVLLAELELRLMPVVGLLAALDKDALDTNSTDLQ